MIDYIKKIPKAELHLHIEGTLEPEMMFELARRNNISIPFNSVDEVKSAYEFTSLQSFLDIYYAGANVLIKKQDFYDLTWAYILKCKEDNIIHTEIFFDPQSHTSRGIAFDTVISGIKEALLDALENFGITSNIIMCFLRHLSQEDAFTTLNQALKYKKDIIAVGLDSSEIGNPPSKFQEVFSKAKKEGFLSVAHAGEEADVSYIDEAIKLLDIQRLDHGVQANKSDELMKYLKETQLPLTVCPNSNIELKVFNTMDEHNVKELLDYGLNVTINSDDPSYFKGYLNDNFIGVYKNLNLDKNDIIKLAKNSINASFITPELKSKYLKMIDNT